MGAVVHPCMSVHMPCMHAGAEALLASLRRHGVVCTIGRPDRWIAVVAAVFLAYALACVLINLGIAIERYGGHPRSHAYGHDQHHWHHHHHHLWPHAEQMPHGRAYGQ